MPEPLVVLDLGTPPRSGNRALRTHWAARRREARDWAVRVLAAWRQAIGSTIPMIWLRKRSAECPRCCALTPTNDPHLQRRVVVRWIAPQPPDKSRALCAVDPIIDCLQRVRRKKVGRGKKGYWMAEVPGVVPILWRDDPDHLDLKYAPERGAPRRLVMEVYEA